MLAPALAVIVLLFLGGLVLGLMQSVNYMPIIGKTTVSLDAYYNLLTGRTFLRSLGFTLYLATAATVISTILAIVCALVLRDTFVGRRLTTFIFQLNLPIPHLVGGVGIMMLAAQSGLLARVARLAGAISEPSQFPALVNDPYGIGILLEYVWKEVPFIGVIVLAVLRSLGTDYEELATSLGANRWQRLRHVLIPLMLPGILSASTIVFAFSFGGFEIPLLLGATFPAPLSVVAYRFYSDADLNARPDAMATSMVITVIIASLTYAYTRLSKAYLRSQ
jgi:putative spermidine/putrescine transport system permease protein